MKQSFQPSPLWTAAKLTGLSLTQLSDLCRVNGTPVHRLRLHRLMHGKTARPSEAEVLSKILKIETSEIQTTHNGESKHDQ